MEEVVRLLSPSLALSGLCQAQKNILFDSIVSSINLHVAQFPQISKNNLMYLVSERQRLKKYKLIC